MTPVELMVVLEQHARYLRGQRGAARANLTMLNLSGMDLSQAQLKEAKLTGSNLNRCVLKGADFSECDLFAIDLSGADLRGANLSWSDMRPVSDHEAPIADSLDTAVAECSWPANGDGPGDTSDVSRADRGRQRRHQRLKGGDLSFRL